MNPLQEVLIKRKKGQAVMSACTAHPLALEAVLDYAGAHGIPALIESTANQVNQYGGYTGMMPVDFAAYIKEMGQGRNTKIILGGDHLGPLVWQNLPEREAMTKASELIRSYVTAGFGKIHIDTSMRLAGDPETLAVETIAVRAASLCKQAEDAANAENPPVYVIGSEVPIPGGAIHNEQTITVTKPEDLSETVSVFRKAFEKQNLQSAWERVVAVVVQPGVEFEDEKIFEYDRERAQKLTDTLKVLSPLVFEAHSTDYQLPGKLRQMAEDGFAIQKVGPALTFAVREALFALEDMEKRLVAEGGRSNFESVLEQVMSDNPANWEKHYKGNAERQAYLRRFSLFDRARYYLTDPAVVGAVHTLVRNINTNKPPMSLISRYMPLQYRKLREGSITLSAESLIKSRVIDCIETYPNH